MKLQILIPQYKETDAIIKPLLDSIALQQRINFNEIGVIICNDGTDILLSDSLLTSYPFKIEYYKCAHRGVSATRNTCLDYASAEYVMFCDADDIFFNMCGLWIIFKHIAIGFDTMASQFLSEIKISDNDEYDYTAYTVDSTFVHGKVHRRQFLIDNNIRFNEELKKNEDTYFHSLIHACSPIVEYCHNPFYMWKWNPSSVTRSNENYLIETFDSALFGAHLLIQELLSRNLFSKAKFHLINMFVRAYFTMTPASWTVQPNQDYKMQVEQQLASYYAQYKDMWNQIPKGEKLKIISAIKNSKTLKSIAKPAIGLDEWLQQFEEK